MIGVSGQLGCWLLWTLAQRGHSASGTYASVQFPGLVRLDAGELQPAADWITEQAADVVFYPAVSTWVDGCERDRSRAYAANLEQPLNLARAAATVGARFVYFSTDYVFDGELALTPKSLPPTRSQCTDGPSATRNLPSTRQLGAKQLTIRTSWGFRALSGKARTLLTNCSGTWP